MARIVSELIYKLIADEADLVKGLKAADKQMTDMSKKFKESGKALTLGLTVPIVAAGGAMVKLASSANESINAVNLTFEGSAKTILDWGKTAAEQAGVSSTEFSKSAVLIGGGLRNMGLSAEEAAQQTINLTKRAADMASVLDADVNEVLTALQAGLRGEAEPLRRFQVSLDAASVSARAVAMGLVDANGEATAYGITQARIAIIMEQSARTQGDFVNTSDGLANSLRITTAMVKNEAEELGTQLLPIVLEVVQGIKGAVSWFSQLSDEQKKAILITAGVAAAIGPVLIGIGQLITAVGSISTAMATLGAASGPVGVAILAIGALVAGIVALNNVMAEQKKKQDELDFGSIAKDIGLTVEKTSELEKDLFFMLPTLNQIAQNTESTAEYTTDWSTEIDDIAKKYGITREKALQVLQASSRITDAQKETAKTLEGMLKNTDELYLAEVKLASFKENMSAQLRMKQAQQVADEKKAEDDKKKAEADAAARRQENQKRINELIDETISKTKTEKEVLLAQIKELEAAKGISDAKRLEAIKILQAQVEALNKQETEQKQAELDAQEQAEEDMLRRIAQADAQETANKKAELDKQLENVKKNIQAQIALAEYAANYALGLATQLTKNESMELDNRLIREKNAIAASTMTEEEKAEAVKKLDREVAIEKAKIAQKQAILEKASAIASIAINTSRAVVEALPNVLLATGIGVLGGIQAAAVLAQPLPEIPSFANGGSFMVPEGFNNDTFPLPAAMVQSGERVTVETPEQQRQGKAVFQIGTVIASPDGYRELERQLKKYGAVETLRRGK